MRFLGRVGLAAISAAGLLGCNDLEVCGSRRETLPATDGNAYRCTTAEDCPRSSGVFVCVTDVSSEQECVTCADTVCTRIIPESCS
ncbi:hypothetical protein POL68_23415 [Stigmatella sp. ncwal1]|uniref:Lipoprotein n=1 Tax=Stigmatella ashevillensis TaxID=2995309 RepID=A0ABT5DE54_9BACT|nr:hypothetical protein [Stigmatella ashevillena]MDC0711440.1 hypothetical protein [Stigmatella ashevillena]